MSPGVASVALPIATVLAFALLTAALAALWAPLLLRRPSARHLWIVPGALSLVAAVAGGVLDARGLLALGLFGALCDAASRASRRALAVALHVALLGLCAALFVHAVPGFDNPRVIDREILSPGAQPYTKYLNFDKGMAALLLLGLHVRPGAVGDTGRTRRWTPLGGFVLLAGAVIVSALALGYVRWDPKLPVWWAVWLWSMVWFTALPEEVLFRGVVQEAFTRWWGGRPAGRRTAILAAGVLFGIAHLAGGPAYVLLASIAGIGYGWVYATTRSLAAATIAHAALNATHLFLFTYPGVG